MEERRRFIRLGLRLSAHYTVLGTSDAHAALTRNVGGGGVSLFTDTRIAPGTMLQVELVAPGHNDPIRFTGEVIWSGALLLEAQDVGPRAFETGIRFAQITPHALELIRQVGSPPPQRGG